jgi:hypothetical protein
MDREAAISFKVRAMERVTSTSSMTQGPAINARGLLPPIAMLFILTVLVKDSPFASFDYNNREIVSVN